MTAPKDCFTIYHGKLQVNVPYDVFKTSSAELDPVRAEEFKKVMMSRYPWITENSMQVVFNKAKREMQTILDERREARGVRCVSEVKDLPSEIVKTKRELERNPDDPMLWMRLGELLCKNGETEEGYKALNKGRSLME